MAAVAANDDAPDAMPRYLSAGVAAAHALWDSPEIEDVCVREAEAYVASCALAAEMDHPSPTPYRAYIDATGAAGDEPVWHLIMRAGRELQVSIAALGLDRRPEMLRALGTLARDIDAQLRATADLLEAASTLAQIERRAAQLALHACSVGAFQGARELNVMPSARKLATSK